MPNFDVIGPQEHAGEAPRGGILSGLVTLLLFVAVAGGAAWAYSYYDANRT